MKSKLAWDRAWIVVALVVVMLFVTTGCAAGDPRYTPDAPAGFWTGVWHGMISFVTLVIGIFNDVKVYEVDNTGGWYDFGFLLGTTGFWGGSWHGASRARWKAHDREWAEVATKVETKMRRKIREWAEAEPDEDWNVVEAKAEAKLKRELRAWADRP